MQIVFKEIFTTFDQDHYPISDQCSHFIPPEIIKNPKAFWSFQGGVYNEDNGPRKVKIHRIGIIIFKILGRIKLLSLKCGFSGCGRGFGGCDGLGVLGGCDGIDGLDGLGGLDGFSEFSGFGGFDGFSGFNG